MTLKKHKPAKLHKDKQTCDKRARQEIKGTKVSKTNKKKQKSTTDTANYFRRKTTTTTIRNVIQEDKAMKRHNDYQRAVNLLE